MFTKRKTASVLLTVLLGVFFAALPVFGVDLGLEFGETLGLTTTDIRTTIGRIINAFLGFLGLLTLLLILYAGFLWMTAGGDAARVDRAKGYLRNGVIGLIIILSAFAITSFVIGAIQSGTVGTGPDSETGPGGGGVPGNSRSFSVQGIAPVGPGPSEQGWPRNYAIQVSFSADIFPGSVSPSSFTVERCNSRLDGAFNEGDCDTAVSGTRTVEANRIVFRPDSTPVESVEDDATYFEGEFWYKVSLNDSLQDTGGRTLTCWPIVGDISATEADAHLCDRAMAFNDLIDVEPPTVSIEAPLTFPPYCSEHIEIRAVARDDFLPAYVQFRLNGGTENLVDEFFADYPDGAVFNSAPTEPLNEFVVQDSIYIDTRFLETGEPITLTAIAYDGVPQSGTQDEQVFKLNPPQCCGEEAECGEDSVCGACAGADCNEHQDCSTSFCNPDTNRCEERPIILDVTPLAAGPGTLITVSGQHFGSRAGSVVFLGAAGDADDVIVEACAPSAWNNYEIVVAVPPGAVNGPIEVRTSAGPTDATNDEFGLVADFTINNELLPGICFLSPNVGASGSAFDIVGSNFGDSIGGSLVQFDGVELGRAGMTWTDSRVSTVVPTVLREGVYPVRVILDGAGGPTSNPVNYALRLSSSGDGPVIQEILPSAGPVDSYISILGTGFGNSRGKVYFHFTTSDDFALGGEPVCADNWRDNYIVVKVPSSTPAPGNLPVGLGDYEIQVETRTSGQVSNRLPFTVNDESVPPGMCSISPASGPPGTVVTVEGEFGSVAVADRGTADTDNSLRFYQSGAIANPVNPEPWNDLDTMAATEYPRWDSDLMQAVVPFEAPNTWPASGPVYLVEQNVWTKNPIPFRVADCNEEDVCAEDETCCANGACNAFGVQCNEDRNSAYAWTFSTGPIPAYPMVYQTTCDFGEGIEQSPSPADRSTDACIETSIGMTFTEMMNNDAIRNPDNIIIEECGNGPRPDCTSGVRVPVNHANGNEFDIDVWDMIPGRPVTVVNMRPDSRVYPSDDPTGLLRPSTWYRVTLKSSVEDRQGLIDQTGRLLDGDRNRQEGGDFIWDFRTRASDDPCEVAGLLVRPGRFTFETEGVTERFDAAPTAANCNELPCLGATAYNIDWRNEGGHILEEPRPGDPEVPAHCYYVASAVSETDEDPDLIVADLAAPGRTLAVTGQSEVRVAFADPIVKEVSPTDGCQEACVNGMIYARFNIPMDSSSFTPANIKLYECRNSACNPPYDSVAITIAPQNADGVTQTTDSDDVVRVGILPVGGLDISTNYVMRLRGGVGTAIVSRSGVPLTGMNAAGWYEWTFRTMSDPEGCLIGSVDLQPNYATLNYVGERLGLKLIAYSRGNSCSPNGQELVVDNYDWDWSIDPNPVLEGFVDAVDYQPGNDNVNVTNTVDTDPTVALGCTSQCLLVGSQAGLARCGNTVVERGEDCDDGNDNPNDGCDNSCLVTGSNQPQCGNGVLDPGENCEALPDPEADGALVFPVGCMDPNKDYDGDGLAEGWGCKYLGSSTSPRSVCGNGLRDDGEACDDGNASNGDGCSRDCLNEGTERNVSSCGNGGAPETGEECDDGNVRNNDGCGADCLLEGSSEVYGSACGDGVIGTGEACDDGNTERGDGCSALCLLEGSSGLYDLPSFCGDGLAGRGEHPACDGIGIATPDGNTDTYQVVQSDNANVDDPAGLTSTVTASHFEVPSGEEGNSFVTLNCSCDVEPDGDTFCEGLAPNLGCAASGCCMSRPRVDGYEPIAERDNICRNGVIRVFFDQQMDFTSVKQNFLVGYDSGSSTGCADGTEVLALGSAGHDFRQAGLLTRIWRGVTDFVHEKIIIPVFGAPPGSSPNENNAFCVVNGQVRTYNNNSGVTVAEFWPSEPYPADSWLRARVLPGAKSVAGVSVGEPGDAEYFGTRTDICRIRRVTINPESDLLSSIDDEHLYIATAHGEADMTIAPMDVYGWEWSWTKQPAGGAGPVSPVVVEEDLLAEEYWFDDGDVLVDVSSDDRAARVRVRGSREWDDPEGYSAQDGEAIVEVMATVTTSELGDINERYTGRSDVVVMLCEHPWPEWRICPAGGVRLPWEQNDGVEPAGETHACTPNSRVWHPFKDRWTNVKFYYCRDTASGGDNGDLLPYLNIEDPSPETPPESSGRSIVRLISPAPGIFREYLFTFDPARSGDGPWARDAFGLRIAGNQTHVGINQWYADRGFQGSPKNLSVGGYDGLRDDRTVYVNAGTQSGSKLYTNVYVMSFNDGAAAETVSVFNQILNRINFNSNLDDTDICYQGVLPVHPADDPEATIACMTDADCEVGICDAPAAKLKRDVRRWSDFQAARRAIDSGGTPPDLREGTFMRSRTYSVWPSWDEVLASQLGINLPKDPVNNLTYCPNDFDQDTCWNSNNRQFFCGADSHIYRYYSTGGIARLNADFEHLSAPARADWSAGETCLDPIDPATCEQRGCQWIDLGNGRAACNYPNTKIWFGNYVTDTRICQDSAVSEEGECGNGVVNDGEQCEIGMRQSASCFRNEVTGQVEGVFEQSCDPNTCLWTPQLLPIDDPACDAGYCGDGIIQPARPEICDDGVLNGNYGRCATNCLSDGFRCGDGKPHPSERCDCDSNNGRYYINGILADFGGIPCADDAFGDASAGSCSWDCQGPAPHCGDGIRNGSEECDGGTQTSDGLCTDGLTPCNSDADCEGGSCDFCPEPEQNYFRTCQDNDPGSTVDDPIACTWGTWTCSEAGFCGNGIKEEKEECDDGNTENNDACTSKCVLNVCGDGYVNWAGGELCDDAGANGDPCTPDYGRTCTFCTTSCQINVRSGAYCGDGVIQNPSSIPPGAESCEPVSYQTNSQHLCVSTRDKDLSFGRLTGVAECSAANCGISCADRESKLCDLSRIESIDNTDGDDCAVAGEGIEECLEQYDYSIETYTAAVSNGTYALPNECDPDDDNDGVPDEYDCNALDPEVRPAYQIPGTSIVIQPGSEATCNDIDNDCNGFIDDAEHHRDTIDMMFVIDVTGSMNRYIQNVIDALRTLTSEISGRGTGNHRFGFVTVSQKYEEELNLRKDPLYQNSFQNLVTFGEFRQDLNEMYDFCWKEWNPNSEGKEAVCDKDPALWDWNERIFADYEKRVHDMGAEPTYAAAYALMQPDNDYNWDYEVNWREDAYPYVVVISDERPPLGDTTKQPEGNMALVDESVVARVAKNCVLPGCQDDNDYVELFIITRHDDERDYYRYWNDTLPEPLNEHDTPVEDRFIDIKNINAQTLKDTIFQKVCGEVE